ncbi:MAG TPA: exopolysaccharide biosynthesis protein [Synechococcales cyanobacterium M55_K2018_004]|nr:exopolysaccharide biosynthesis protein [Synechococcales cyanobacterium M55_K2018_004]
MKLSETLDGLLQEFAGQPLSLQTLVERTADHGFGLLTGLLIVPMLIPLPVPIVGYSTVFASGIILVGLQLALGCQRPWLPRRLGRLQLPPSFSQSILKNINRLLNPLERIARSRLPQVSENRLLRRCFGLCLVWNALLMGLPLPIPFTNVLPAYSILVFAIASLESDGVLLLLGYAMTGLTTAYFISIAGVTWTVLQQLEQQYFPHLF